MQNDIFSETTMIKLRNISLNLRLQFIVGLFVLCSFAMNWTLLRVEKRRAFEDRVVELRALVQASQGIAAHLQQEEAAGRMTRQQAVDAFRTTLRGMRFGKDDYLFVYANDGTVVLLPPQPQLEGQNRMSLKDTAGRPMISDLIQAAKRGGGVVEVTYPHPGTTLPVPKINYVEPLHGWNMLIAAGVFVDDLQAQYWQLVTRVGLTASLMTGAGALLAWLLGRSITRPLASLEVAMTSLANGDLTVDVVERGRGDEIGRMARAVAVFKSQAVAKQELEATRMRSEAEAQVAQRRMAGQLADQLQERLGQIADALHAASGRLMAAADEMRNATDLADGQTTSAKALVDGTSSNVEMVASATEQLASSIHEISGQVTKSSTIAIRAVEEARRTDATVQRLRENATLISSIIQVISGIAAKTNLLALNATIEAARAGDAGRGFAVVASEVKSLANQTAKATEEIGAQIEQIQAATADAVAAIASIGDTINEINGLTSGVAAAVEQQGAATSEISRNVRQAASGTSEVSACIAGASKAVSIVGGAAGAVVSAAEALAGQSRTLNEQLGQLIEQVRAA
ncbi:MAG TPA: cache domain-containing protein [Rhodopila sp.]|nr:cache domain-containing protein [Rhodopila sp.]